MPLALATSDNADDTGATATISGSAVGSSNQVFVQTFLGDLGSAGSWVSQGTRTGDGALALPVAAGHYFAYLASTSAGVTSVAPVDYFVATTGADSVHGQCLDAVAAGINALSLAGLESIMIQGILSDRDVGITKPDKMPAVILAGYREARNPQAGNNVRDDVILPVLCAVVQASNQSLAFGTNERRAALWIEKISNLFHNQRLAGVAEVYTAAVEPQDFAMTEAWKQNLLASVLLIKFVARLPRGLNA